MSRGRQQLPVPAPEQAPRQGAAEVQAQEGAVPAKALGLVLVLGPAQE